MKTHKTVFRYYTIMEYEKEQEWLSPQHRQGWKGATGWGKIPWL